MKGIRFGFLDGHFRQRFVFHILNFAITRDLNRLRVIYSLPSSLRGRFYSMDFRMENPTESLF